MYNSNSSALVCVLWFSFLAYGPTVVQAQSCPGVGDCCTAHGGPGCSDVSCCNLVCSVDSFCCIAWGQSCANSALALCDESACLGPNCPGDGPCCSTHSGMGCDNTACCEAVCEFDADCCTFAWDSICVDAAEVLCPTICEANPPCATSGDCCAAHGGSSCESESCCQAVCADRPECCDESWDASCAALAVTLCSGLCGAGHPACPGADVCCHGTSTEGCQSRSCCNLVCDADSWCCDVYWDNTCAGMAIDLCPALCTCDSFGDFDGNAAVNLRDVADFLNCFTGSSTPWPDGCACAASDTNDRVDLLDYKAFQALLGG